jgi:AcrR family transcriptional regulator
MLPPMAGAPAAKRAAVVAAARTIFAEQGFGPARVGDIADRAGVAKGTVYMHFATKEDLLLEAVLADLGERRARAEALLGAGGAWGLAMPAGGAGADPAAALRRITATLLAEMPAGAGTGVRLLVDLWTASRERPELLAKAQARMAEIEGQWEGVVAYLIGAGQAAGRFRAGDPRIIARWLTATIDGACWQAPFRTDHDPIRFAADTADALVALIAV